MLLRQRVKDAARAVMSTLANGADLDHIAALFGVARLLITPADALNGIAAVYGSDADRWTQPAHRHYCLLEHHASRPCRVLIRQRYDEADGPFNLSALSHEALHKLPDAKSSKWFDKGSFRKALDNLSLLHVHFSGHLL